MTITKHITELQEMIDSEVLSPETGFELIDNLHEDEEFKSYATPFETGSHTYDMDKVGAQALVHIQYDPEHVDEETLETLESTMCSLLEDIFDGYDLPENDYGQYINTCADVSTENEVPEGIALKITVYFYFTQEDMVTALEGYPECVMTDLFVFTN